MKSKPKDTKSITVETGNDVYVKSEHFTTTIKPFDAHFQFAVSGDVGNYYMAVSYKVLPELLKFLAQVNDLVATDNQSQVEPLKPAPKSTNDKEEK